MTCYQILCYKFFIFVIFCHRLKKINDVARSPPRGGNDNSSFLGFFRQFSNSAISRPLPGVFRCLNDYLGSPQTNCKRHDELHGKMIDVSAKRNSLFSSSSSLESIRRRFMPFAGLMTSSSSESWIFFFFFRANTEEN